MAKRIWRGDAVKVAQVVRVTCPAEVSVDHVYGLRINSKDILATGATAAALVTAFVTAIAATSIPEWREVTPVADGDVLVLTSKTAGVPFKVSTLVDGFSLGAAIVVTVSHTPSGGTWLFDAGDYGTSNIGFADSQATFQTAMDTRFGAGNTSVTKRSYAADDDLPARFTYTIEFIGALAGEAVPVVEVSYANLTGGDGALVVTLEQAAVVGTSEVQTITFYGSASGGTFRFRFRGAFVDQAYNVSTAAMQTAIRTLATINGANVDVTGTAGTSYVCTFKNALAHQALDAIEIDTANLTGGTIYASIAVTTPGVTGLNDVQYIVQECIGAINEIITIERSGTVSGGTFTLTYDTGANEVETDPIAYDAKLYEIIEALEALVVEEMGTSYAGPYFAPANTGQYANDTIDDAGGTLAIACIAQAGGIEQFGSSGGFLEPIGINDAGLTGGGSYTCPGGSSVDGNAYSQTRATDGKFRMRFGSTGTFTSEFTLACSVLGIVTSPTVAAVQAAFEALPEIGAGNVLVTSIQQGIGGYGDGSGTARGLWRVELRNALAGVSLPLIYEDSANLVTTGSNWKLGVYRVQEGVAGTTEVQTLTVNGTPSTGSLTLGFSGGTTAAIAYNAPALAVESSLVALPQFDNGDIAATGGALATAPVPLTFGGQYTYTDVPTITVDDNLLKVGVVKTTPGVTGKNEIQKLSLSGQDIWAGTVTMTIEGDTVSALPFDSELADIITELETSSGVTAGDLSGSYGGPWPEEDVFVVFGGALAETDADLITATDALKNGTATAVSYDPLIVRTTVRATGPNHVNNGVNWYNPDAPTEVRQPERSDAVTIPDGKVDILYGLIQFVEFTVDTVGNWLIPGTDHDLLDGQIVEVWTTAADQPNGLSVNTSYYVRDLDSITGKFKLATTAAGDAIDITDAGTGTHYVGVRLTSYMQLAGYTGKIGLPWMNQSGYKEFRPLDLKYGVLPGGTKVFTVGQGDGNGSGRTNLDTGTELLTLEVLASGSSSETNKPAIHWTGENSSVAINLYGGDLGIAKRPTEEATFGALSMRGGTLALGKVAFASMDKTGGTLGTIDEATLSGVQKIRG